MQIKNLKINGKKLAALLLTGTIALSTLTGCTTKQTETPQETVAVETTQSVETGYVPYYATPLSTPSKETVSIREPEKTELTYVYEDNIIGDIYLESDRSESRKAESESLEALFTNQTNRSVSIETISEVLELSDVLNGFNPGPNEYSNTSYSNVVTFNPELLYYRYQNILASGDEEAMTNFCIENMANEANVDAWVTFGCGTVLTEIENRVVTLVKSQINSNGLEIIGEPFVKATPTGFFVVLNYGGRIVKVNLTGEYANNLKDVYATLKSHFDIAIDNVAGINNTDGKGYENSFAQNGVYIGHEDDSVFLSIGDDYKKDDLRAGISLAKDLRGKTITVSTSFANDDKSLNEGTKTTLRYLGYSDEEISKAIELNVSLSKEKTLSLQ